MPKEKLVGSGGSRLAGGGKRGGLFRAPGNGTLAALMDKPAVEWSPAETALFLSSIGLGAAGKSLAAFVEAQEVPGYMLLANSTKAQDLVEMFEGHLSIGRARAIIFQLESIRASLKSGSDDEDVSGGKDVSGGASRKRKAGSGIGGSKDGAHDGGGVNGSGNGRGGKEKKPRKRRPRPHTAYLLFCADKRQEMLAEGVLPAGKGEAMKALGAAWTHLGREDRIKYQELAAQAKKEYAEKSKAAAAAPGAGMVGTGATSSAAAAASL